MSVTHITKLYITPAIDDNAADGDLGKQNVVIFNRRSNNYHKQRQGIGMENQFIRHEPYFERILFVLTLDKKKMKERILIGGRTAEPLPAEREPKHRGAL